MTTYAIIGDGATGTTAAFYLRRGDPQGRIALYSDESTPAYYRSALTNYLMGELRPEQLFAVPPNFYSDFRVDRFLTRVVGVDGPNKKLKLSDGQVHPFDKLLIAAGARARSPSFPGADLGGVMTMRTMQDARFIMDEVQSGRLKRGVIVGGGILGLELVAGLRARKIDVSYVIRGNRLMPTLLDQVASDLVISRCRHFDVDVRLDEEVAEARPSRDRYFRTAALKNSGDAIEGDLMVVAIGTNPNVEFLDGSGVTVNLGVPVDERMQTNVEGVFAGGDIVEVDDPRVGRMIRLGLWEPSRHHGRIAGINMTGGSAIWRLPIPYNATRLYDLDLAAIGESVEQPGDELEIDFPQTGRSIVYKKLVFRNNRLVGAILLGQRKELVRERGSKYRELIASRIDVSRVRESLLDPLFDLNSWMDSLGEDATRGGRRSRSHRMDISKVMGRPAASSGAVPSPDSAPQGMGEPRRSLSALMRSPVRESPGPSSTEASASPESSSAVGANPALKLPDGSVKALGLERLTIGTAEGNDIVVQDSKASSRHAELRRAGAEMLVADLGSGNGTFVNEMLVASPRPLTHGDVIRIGASQFIFVNQVLLPRPDTGPVGLPEKPLQHPGGGALIGTLKWEGQTVDLGRSPVTIGRDPDETQVTLADKSVSWIHAEISRHDDEHYLRDLGSRNGTFVNGELLTIPRALRGGDVVHVGNTDLIFETLEKDTVPFVAPPNNRPGADNRPAGLVGTSGPLLGIWFALRERQTTLGRGNESEVVIEDLTVSRRHAQFERTDEGWTIQDLGSTNGTWLDDRKLGPHEPQDLKPEHRIKMGRVEFRLGTLPPESPQASASGPAPKPGVERQATTVMDASELLAADRRDDPSDGKNSVGSGEPAERAPQKLRIEKGPQIGQAISLTELPVILGREGAEGVTGVGDEYVSARHLEIKGVAAGIEVVDLGSRNGTWVDEERLEPGIPRQISAGAKLKLGPVSVLVVEE